MRLWVVLAMPGLLLAQPMHPPRAWWDGDLNPDLKLTDAQTKEILQTRHDFRSRMLDTRTAVNQAEKDVAAAFDEDPVDQAKANAAIERLAAARAEATRTVSDMELKFRMILSAQQWQQLKQGDRGWPGRGHRGPPRVPTPNQK